MDIKIREVESTAYADFPEDTQPLLKKIYQTRGITCANDLDRTLAGLNPPHTLLGLDAALTLLHKALTQQQRILVVGDFDVDGATSTALTILALKAMGLKHIDFLVPNRFEYGYGLTPEIVALAKEQSPHLIITVDNGISSIEGVETANKLGINVLVTDHHLPGNVLPSAAAIINPNQPGCTFPSKNLAGVGVVFYLMSALRTHLRNIGWFTDQKIAEPNMANWLDLVALGTVADVVPLDKTNRIFVHQGLMRIRAGKTQPGVLALMAIAGRDHQRISASDLGFALGPRLNAAGRLDDMSTGIQCLLTTDPEHARQYALQLDELNRDRRVIEAGMQQEGEAIVAKLNLEKEGDLPWGLCLFDKSWHQGVVGLLASRIKEKTHRPVFAFAQESNGDLKGSGRSIAGLHIRDALDAVATQHPGLISKFGGHAMAAGLSLPEQNFPQFCTAFDTVVKQWLEPCDLLAEILTDGLLAADQTNLSTAKLLAEAGPWGQHFPEPLFVGEFELLNQRIVGEKHLKMVVCFTDNPQQPIDAIAFNVDTKIWPKPNCSKVKLVYKLDINVWRNKESLQLMVDYIEPLHKP